MAYRNGGGGRGKTAVELSREMKLAELRAAQPPGLRKATKAVIEAMEKELILRMDEVTAGVRTSGRAASFTATAAWSGGKKNAFKCRVNTRVRTPSEPVELAFHLDDEEQLALGFPPDYEPGDEKASKPDDAEAEDARTDALEEGKE